MGYSITTTDTLSSTLRITKTAYLRWKEQHLPESNPLDRLSLKDFGALPTCQNGHEQDRDKPFCPECGVPVQAVESTAPIERFFWGGVGSSNYYHDGTLGRLAADLEGEADIIFTWEGGDSFSAVRIKDGKATEHKVEMALGDLIKEL